MCGGVNLHVEFCAGGVHDDVLRSLIAIILTPYTQAPHKIAIEADGPLHFTRNQDEAAGHPRALGNTWLRDALLASHDGCVVVQVPWWEWEALPDAVSKQAWLARACRDVLDDLLLLTPDN